VSSLSLGSALASYGLELKVECGVTWGMSAWSSARP
jgi:hypothetical protein